MVETNNFAGGQNSPTIMELLSTWAGNFQYQTTKAVTNLCAKDYIRLIVIIGGYCLLRPYLMQLGAKMQEKAHERDSATAVDSGTALDANDLRGGKKAPIPGIDSDDEEDEEQETETGDWGRNARLRQRKYIRQQLEEHERRLREEAEAASDKDIEEFLVD